MRKVCSVAGAAKEIFLQRNIEEEDVSNDSKATLKLPPLPEQEFRD